MILLWVLGFVIAWLLAGWIAAAVVALFAIIVVASGG